MTASRISEQRKLLGLTQEELANKLQVSQKSISKYERGTRRPSYETLAQMSELFGVTIDYLLGKTSNPTAKEGGFFFFFFDQDIKETFVSRLNNVLSEKKMDLESLAESTGIAIENCNAYFQGEQAPSIEDLIKISHAVNVSTEYLLGQIDISEEKVLSSFKQLNEDNKDIIVGKIKELLKEQRYEASVAAEPRLKQAK